MDKLAIISLMRTHFVNNVYKNSEKLYTWLDTPNWLVDRDISLSSWCFPAEYVTESAVYSAGCDTIHTFLGFSSLVGFLSVMYCLANQWMAYNLPIGLIYTQALIEAILTPFCDFPEVGLINQSYHITSNTPGIMAVMVSKCSISRWGSNLTEGDIQTLIFQQGQQCDRAICQYCQIYCQNQHTSTRMP